MTSQTFSGLFLQLLHELCVTTEVRPFGSDLPIMYKMQGEEDEEITILDEELLSERILLIVSVLIALLVIVPPFCCIRRDKEKDD